MRSDRTEWRSRRGRPAMPWLAAGLLAAVLSAAYAQYPGHIDTRKKRGPSPRAIAVLEWTGQPGKPSASRMIPISVFDGETYQPGGLYLARPEPLALEPGTEYVLQQAGIAKGLFDVASAQDQQGYWFGYGSWRQMAPPPRPHPLKPARVMPQVVKDADDGRPHFKRRDSGSSSPASTPAPSSQAPPADPDRPTLSRRAGSSGDNGGTQTPSQSGSSTSTPSGSGSASNTSAPPADPDRPTLRRRAGEDSPSFAPPGPETAIGGPDPDRPHLSYGSNNPTGAKFEEPKLTGTPSDLQQMIAVSDAVDREPHPFGYSWANPGDAAKMQTQMEALAQKALAPPPPARKTAKSSTAAASARRHTRAATAHRARKAAAPPPLVLTDERFNAYELTYGSGATLIFSARNTDAAGKARYVTLIAQPDFDGVPHVIFQSVTDDSHLDDRPRMRLVDAVDARANNRGDLVFELRGRRDRQFAIYEVAGGRVQQIFTTGSLPEGRAG